LPDFLPDGGLRGLGSNRSAAAANAAADVVTARFKGFSSPTLKLSIDAAKAMSSRSRALFSNRFLSIPIMPSARCPNSSTPAGLCAQPGLLNALVKDEEEAPAEEEEAPAEEEEEEEEEEELILFLLLVQKLKH